MSAATDRSEHQPGQKKGGPLAAQLHLPSGGGAWFLGSLLLLLGAASLGALLLGLLLPRRRRAFLLSVFSVGACGLADSSAAAVGLVREGWATAFFMRSLRSRASSLARSTSLSASL